MLKIDRNVIHVNLSVAIAIANALFLSADSATKEKVRCMTLISLGNNLDLRCERARNSKNVFFKDRL